MYTKCQSKVKLKLGFSEIEFSVQTSGTMVILHFIELVTFQSFPENLTNVNKVKFRHNTANF